MYIYRQTYTSRGPDHSREIKFTLVRLLKAFREGLVPFSSGKAFLSHTAATLKEKRRGRTTEVSPGNEVLETLT